MLSRSMNADGHSQQLQRPGRHSHSLSQQRGLSERRQQSSQQAVAARFGRRGRRHKIHHIAQWARVDACARQRKCPMLHHVATQLRSPSVHHQESLILPRHQTSFAAGCPRQKAPSGRTRSGVCSGVTSSRDAGRYPFRCPPCGAMRSTTARAAIPDQETSECKVL